MNNVYMRYTVATFTVLLLFAGIIGCESIGESSSEKEVFSDRPIVLKIATFNYHDSVIRDFVTYFRSTNPDIHIEVVDYSEFSITGSDQSIGLNRLYTDIITGDPPDILDISGGIIPVDEWVLRGLFADLYPFMDSDPEINISDFTEGIPHAIEIDGYLYYIPREFNILTITGRLDVVGSDSIWSMGDFIDVLTEYPEADIPLGPQFSKIIFLQQALVSEIDKYIDWESGTACFDSPEFVELLEIANIFADNPDYTVNETETIAAGHQIMTYTRLLGFHSHKYWELMYGGEIVYKGFPNSSGNGNCIDPIFSLAIMERSPNKEVAWTVVKANLNKDWQLRNTMVFAGFPTNQAAFDTRITEALSEGYVKDIFPHLPVENLTQADIDKVSEVIKDATNSTNWNFSPIVRDIIAEEALNYFNGSRSAYGVADIIQSRISLYLSELKS